MDRESDEGPQTTVPLTRGYWMGKYEVTQDEYLSLMSSNPSCFAGDLSRPVERVSWVDATNFCRALTQQERAAGRIPVNCQYRLPTEAECEYACRAGATTRFNYGDDPGYTSLGNYAWYDSNSGSTTHPVGQKLANPWGLMDMHGNAWEERGMHAASPPVWPPIAAACQRRPRSRRAADGSPRSCAHWHSVFCLLPSAFAPKPNTRLTGRRLTAAAARAPAACIR